MADSVIHIDRSTFLQSFLEDLRSGSLQMCMILDDVPHSRLDVFYSKQYRQLIVDGFVDSQGVCYRIPHSRCFTIAQLVNYLKYDTNCMLIQLHDYTIDKEELFKQKVRNCIGITIVNDSWDDQCDDQYDEQYD